MVVLLKYCMFSDIGLNYIAAIKGPFKKTYQTVLGIASFYIILSPYIHSAPKH